jgi:hypothetical protein
MQAQTDRGIEKRVGFSSCLWTIKKKLDQKLQSNPAIAVGK